VDSLPEQHIEYLPGATRKDAYDKLTTLCWARGQRWSEQEIAEKLGFNSPDAMYRQLENWRLLGLVPPEKAPPEALGAQTAKPKRKARSSEDGGEELPPAARATEIFRVAIWTLEADLEYLQHHREVLQGNSFVQTATTPSGDLVLRGVSPIPSWRLVRLITAALMNVSYQAQVEDLLRALHPNPETVDLKDIARQVTGVVGTGKNRRRRDDALKPIARKLAVLMRGGTLKRGKKRPQLDQWEHLIVDTIQHARRQGVEEDEIRRVMLEDYGLQEDEFARLSKIIVPE
jgi:hypothetical protein